MRHGLTRLLRGRTGPVSLLDVGTGAGDIPRMARDWCEARGMRLAAFGVERHPAAARMAQGGGLQTSIGCGGSLPLRDAGVDVVVLSQVAHHLDADSCIAVFRECNRVARIGVIVADVRVQGDRASEEVARAIRAIGRRHAELRVDALLITRGGGSKEDLWSFNERVVAEAIVRRAPCPVFIMKEPHEESA